MATVMAATALKLRRRKRKFEEVMNDLYTFKEPKSSGPRTKYDRERALKCVQDDWLGLQTLFSKTASLRGSSVSPEASWKN
eukprot:scaffold394967_cov51-Attheya_sp.AAC.1